MKASVVVAAALALLAGASNAMDMVKVGRPRRRPEECKELPTLEELQMAMNKSLPASAGGSGPSNGGLDFPMWATVVGHSGVICAVAYSGANWQAPWLASRYISMQKASCANSLSGANFAISTANLYSAVQAGGTLYGVQAAYPFDPSIYEGSPADYGTTKDPAIGKRCGGMNVFGGGVGLYKNISGVIVKVGGLGVSGDTSCADHNAAWRIRMNLGLDKNLGNVGGVVGVSDAMVNDRLTKPLADTGVAGASTSGWGHPVCTQASLVIGRGMLPWPAVAK